MTDVLTVEIAIALPGTQVLQALEVDPGSTVADVVAASRILEAIPDVPISDFAAGIWGRPVDRDCLVSDGDRVELYRPLQIDPREARRKLADAGLTMGKTPGDQ